MSAPPEAPRDCPLCPRLAAYRAANRAENPDWFNGAAPSFGDETARLIIVGLAPGRTGANRTGRPFTGDFAGELLYGTLLKLGFAEGVYDARPDDGFTLRDALITNAVRCAPPENKPLPVEIATCQQFLAARLAACQRARAIVPLGTIAHESVVRVYGRNPARTPFGHGAQADLARDGLPTIRLFSSYHCSRYNTQTRRLTPEMFEAVLGAAGNWARG